MAETEDAPLRLREAKPEDLSQLEAWCHAHRPAETPPFIAVTLSEFVASATRGFLLIVVEGGRERGFVVVSRLWSNRSRDEAAVVDDCVLEPGIDVDLVRHEIARFVKLRGISRLFFRGEDGALALN